MLVPVKAVGVVVGIILVLMLLVGFCIYRIFRYHHSSLTDLLNDRGAVRWLLLGGIGLWAIVLFCLTLFLEIFG